MRAISDSHNKKLFNTWHDEGKITDQAYGYLTNGKWKKWDEEGRSRQLKISVAISTFQRPQLLIRLLDSITNQTYENYEVIIVDDASNDETGMSVSEYMKCHHSAKITYGANKINMGVGECKKKAYLQCTGDIIIFCDDDDYYIDNRYFAMLNTIYLNNPDCIMTVAGTIVHYEARNEYLLKELNFTSKISNGEYFNGFAKEFTKPGSMITMSVRAASSSSRHYGELKYFNDTSLYLFGLLADGMVYPINKAVGIYYINGKNMTGNAGTDYTIWNLDSKDDIYRRALVKGLIKNPEKWYYYNIGMTAGNYLKNNKAVVPGDLRVWEWIKMHYTKSDYYKYIVSVLIHRIRKGLPINLKYIKF